MSIAGNDPLLTGPRPSAAPARLLWAVVFAAAGGLWGAVTGAVYAFGAVAWETAASFLFRFLGILVIATFSGLGFAVLFMFLAAVAYAALNGLFGFSDPAREPAARARLGCLAIPSLIGGTLVALLLGVIVTAGGAARGGEMAEMVLRVGTWAVALTLLVPVCVSRSVVYMTGFLSPRNAARFGYLLAAVVAVLALTLFGPGGNEVRRLVVATLLWAVSGAAVTAVYWIVVVWPAVGRSATPDAVDRATLENAGVPVVLHPLALRLAPILRNFVAVGQGLVTGAVCGATGMTAGLALEWPWEGASTHPLYWIPAGVVIGTVAGVAWSRPPEAAPKPPEPVVTKGTVVTGEVIE